MPKNYSNFKFQNIPYNKPIPSAYALELRGAVKFGDEETSERAMQELIDRNRALTKVANNALARLEKAGFERWAYDRAVTYTESEYGMKRFTTSREKLPEAVDLQVNIQELSKFLSSKSSTVRGNKAIDLSIINAFRDMDINIPKKYEKDFIDLISSDEWEQLKQTTVPSGVAIDDMSRLTSSGYNVNIRDLKNVFERMVSGKDSITYDVGIEVLEHMSAERKNPDREKPITIDIALEELGYKI